MIGPRDLGRLKDYTRGGQPPVVSQPVEIKELVEPNKPEADDRLQIVITPVLSPPVVGPIEAEAVPEAVPAVEEEPQIEPTAQPMHTLRPVPYVRKKRSYKKPLLAFGVVGLLAISAGAGFLMFHNSAAASPVPDSYKTAVDYPIYYPDPSKLPAGYKLNPNSFSHPTQTVIIYSLSNPRGQKLEVSLQEKPADSDLQAFDDHRIPLHTIVNTPIGDATVGAIGNQTVASLPTNTKAWILVTAPQNINKDVFSHVLASFTY